MSENIALLYMRLIQKLTDIFFGEGRPYPLKLQN